MDKDKIEVEVVYALPTQQRVLVVRLPAKSTVAELCPIWCMLEIELRSIGHYKLPQWMPVN